MNRIILAVIFSILGMSANAYNQEDVLLVIAGKMITVADFQSAYYRQCAQADGSKSDVQKFLQQYVNRYLQVMEAEAQGLDAQPQYQMLLAGVNSADKSSFAQSVSTEDRVRIADLFLPLKQHCSNLELQNAKQRMDSIYQVAQLGADFMQLIQSVAPQTSSVRWIGVNQTLTDIESAAFNLSDGAISSPVLTVDGFHLLKRLENQSVAISALVRADGSSPDYRSGLLMHCLYEKELKGKAQNDLMGMVQYFEKNQKDYAWDIPHYKGVLYQCKDKKTLKKVRKLLSKNPMDQWNDIMAAPANQSLFQQVQIEPVKLYRLSENEQVDELAFGGPKVAPDATYPFKGVSGKLLKKLPDSYQDVQDELIMDYQNYLEQEWLASLHKKYEVAVNEKALKLLIKNK